MTFRKGESVDFSFLRLHGRKMCFPLVFCVDIGLSVKSFVDLMEINELSIA